MGAEESRPQEPAGYGSDGSGDDERVAGARIVPPPHQPMSLVQALSCGGERVQQFKEVTGLADPVWQGVGGVWRGILRVEGKVRAEVFRGRGHAECPCAVVDIGSCSASSLAAGFR